MATTNWQRGDISTHYLEQVRGGIPFGAEQVNLMLNLVHHFCANPKTIVDLGCGNGFLAEVLLRTYPDATAILIDHSKPMIDAAKQHMSRFSDRCSHIHSDLSESIEKYAETNSVDCIVSGFAIHHLPNEQKKKLYREIYSLLSDGGMFINIEHVASVSSRVEELYDGLFIEHLASHNNKNIEEVAKDYHNRPDKEDNILERVDIQLNWLRDIGFNHVDCYFKWMELAVFGGVK